MKVKCLAHEHNKMFPTRPRRWTIRSGDQRTNHEATALPIKKRSNSGQTYMTVFSAGLYYILGLLAYTTQMNSTVIKCMFVCMYGIVSERAALTQASF